MKLSALHNTGGLSGSIRNPATGEKMHFNFQRNTTRMLVQVVLGDKHVDAWLRIEKVPSDGPTDDMDVELTLRVPDVGASSALDYKPAITKPAGASIDIDGAPMAATTEADEVRIKEGPPPETREMVFSEEDRAQFPIESNPLPIAEAGDVNAAFSDTDAVEPRAEVPEATAADAAEGPEGSDRREAPGPSSAGVGGEHPAVRVPDLPGVGENRRRKSRR